MANLVLLSGTLDGDPRYKLSKKGAKFALLNVRCRNPFNGGKNDWHHIVCHGRLAEACGLHLKDGVKILIIGQIEKSRWKEGDIWRTRWQVVARSITLDFHQWATEWLQLALHLATQDQESPWEPDTRLRDAKSWHNGPEVVAENE